MPPRPPLTPEEQRTIRDWSFAMAAIYSMILLVLLVSAIVQRWSGALGGGYGRGGNATRRGRCDIIEPAPRPLTEASMQQ